MISGTAQDRPLEDAQMATLGKLHERLCVGLIEVTKHVGPHPLKVDRGRAGKQLAVVLNELLACEPYSKS